ncbi:10075_t:CDS:2 [Ambispora leptoticha]|uniref:10075_t:CDS:1 n=1 Tax=Ambispora leptoticha TaxID=144679 RepID=A0A9N9DEV0_9GLOM|nr:10075_t:CDS:2 [Ambispora leptoticha]
MVNPDIGRIARWVRQSIGTILDLNMTRICCGRQDLNFTVALMNSLKGIGVEKDKSMEEENANVAYQETDRFNLDPYNETYENSDTFADDMNQDNNCPQAPLLIDPNDDDQQPPIGQNNQPNQNDPMTFLDHQIGNLVLQMQNNPAPQINISAINLPAQNQDVEKAFEANQVQDNRKILIVIPYLKGTVANWWVTARTIRPAIDRWNDPHHGGQSFHPHFIAQFQTPSLKIRWSSLPDTAKAQIFINGLRPELSTAVASFMPNTLSAAYERAKAFENSFKQNPFFYNPYLMAFPQSAAMISSNPPAVNSSNMEEVLVKFTKTLNMTGHYAHNCTNPLPHNNLGAVTTESNATPLGQNNRPQNNLPPINNNDAPVRAHGNEAQTFLNLHFDENEPLFLPADESEKPAHSTRSKRRRVEDSTLQDLLEEERTSDLEEIRDSDKEPKRKVAVAAKPKKEINMAPVRKRKVEDNPPQIFALIPQCLIISNIRDKPANITFRQLLQVVFSFHSDLAKSLCKTKTPKKRTRTFINLQPTPKSTALYCDAMVQDKVIPLIVDSGSSGSVVSSHLFSELGEILDFLYLVRGVVVPINVVVTDAPSYQAIVGNDWLSKINANIDYNTFKMTFKWKDQEIINDDKESDDSESEDETESEYEEEELKDRLFGFSEDESITFRYYRDNMFGPEENDDSDDSLVASWYNIHSENLGASDAWWNIDSDDNYKLPGADIFSDFDDDELEPQHEFFFDQMEEPSRSWTSEVCGMTITIS